MKKHLSTAFICAIGGIYACNASAADFYSLITSFHKSRSTGVWTDFKLISSKDQKEHACHKILLASSNTYWSRLLKPGMSEAEQGFAEFPYSSKTLQTILDVIYKKKLEIKSISLTTYAELLEFASLSFDNDLSRLLSSISVNFSGEEYLGAFNLAIQYKNQHLADQLFENIQNLEPDIKLANSIIASIAENNIMIHNCIWAIRSSKLFAFLERIKQAQFGNSQLIFYNIDYQHILNMETWTKEETEAALLDERYKLAELELIQLLEEELINRAIALQIDNAEKLASFCTAHFYTLSFFSLWDTAGWTARYALKAGAKGWDEAFHSATKIIESLDLRTASAAIVGAVRAFDDRWYMPRQGINCEAEMIHNTLKNAVKAAVTKLDQNNPYEIGKATGRLCYLFALAYIAKGELTKNYFLMVYNDIYKQFENKPYFKSAKKEDVIELIAKETWGKDELAKNAFIISLKNIMTIMAKD